MQVELRNIQGNGSVEGPSLVSYSYSEDVTSLNPSQLGGGTSQVNATALAVNGDKVGNTHPDSKLLINNRMSLVHTDSGEVQFTVKQVSKNIDVVSIVGDTIQAQLNKEVTAGPHGGSGYTLLTALNYYCRLGDIYELFGTVADFASLPSSPAQYSGYITSDTGKFYVRIGSAWVEKTSKLTYEGTLRTDLDEIAANFIGWRGNLWERLKMFCAAISASASDNVSIEAYIDVDTLVFRKANTTLAQFDYNDLSSQSIDINSFNAAQKFEIYNYNTSYRNDGVVQSLSISKENLPSIAQNATIGDAIQVDAGQTVVRRYTINASLDNVNQPTPVDSILPLPYSGSSGQYVVAGSDGILLKASQWTAQGGRLTVALTENPNEIEITVVAPGNNSVAQAVGAAVGYAPYKVGVEVADGAEYPALYITGDGVFYQKEAHTIFTGADTDTGIEESAPTIDNMFITNMQSLYTKGMTAAQAICGPSVTLSESVGTIQEFGSTPGKLRLVESNKYRINNVSYSAEGTQIVGTASATFADFNAIWTDLDFADFTNTALNPSTYPNDAMKFNEFTVIPLMNAEPTV